METLQIRVLFSVLTSLVSIKEGKLKYFKSYQLIMILEFKKRTFCIILIIEELNNFTKCYDFIFIFIVFSFECHGNDATMVECDTNYCYYAYSDTNKNVTGKGCPQKEDVAMYDKLVKAMNFTFPVCVPGADIPGLYLNSNSNDTGTVCVCIGNECNFRCRIIFKDCPRINDVPSLVSPNKTINTQICDKSECFSKPLQNDNTTTEITSMSTHPTENDKTTQNSGGHMRTATMFYGIIILVQFFF